MESNLEFENAPLLTVERLYQEPALVVTPMPPWAKGAWLVPTDDAGDEPGVVYLVGDTLPQTINLSLCEAAATVLLTMLGHTVVVDTDGKGRAYVRLNYRDAPHHLTVLRRIFIDAGPGEEAKGLLGPRHIGAEHSYKLANPGPKKESRALAIRMAMELAERRQAEGTLPITFDIAEYRAAILAMFAEVDRIHSGK